METNAGVPLTKKEIELIKSLERLSKKWKETTDRLWLYSASGTLCVMMRGGTKSNPEPDMTRVGGVNDKNTITSIDIPNDGGDW